MRRLLAFELKKIWRKINWKILLLLVCLMYVWVLVAGGINVLYMLSPNMRAVQEEFRPYWGQPITDELKEIAKQRIGEFGLTDYDGSLTLTEIREIFPSGGTESDIVLNWHVIYTTPTYEEEKEMWDMMAAEGQGTSRARNPAVYEIRPLQSAWVHWLDFQSYGSLFMGVGTLAFCLILLADAFSMEEGGKLGEICLTTRYSMKWVGAKTLACAITGSGIALILYGGLLLIYGAILGFQGWNVSALSCLGGGWMYGNLFRSVTCLQLAALKMVFYLITGAFMGLLAAACSAVTRNRMAAAGLFLVLCLLMESLCYVEGGMQLDLAQNAETAVAAPHMDWDMITVFCLTPLRAFLNVEVLTAGSSKVFSAFYNDILYNIMITPDLCAAFYGMLLLGSGICGLSCFLYARRR